MHLKEDREKRRESHTKTINFLTLIEKREDGVRNIEGEKERRALFSTLDLDLLNPREGGWGGRWGGGLERTEENRGQKGSLKQRG